MPDLFTCLLIALALSFAFCVYLNIRNNAKEDAVWREIARAYVANEDLDRIARLNGFDNADSLMTAIELRRRGGLWTVPPRKPRPPRRGA